MNINKKFPLIFSHNHIRILIGDIMRKLNHNSSFQSSDSGKCIKSNSVNLRKERREKHLGDG